MWGGELMRADSVKINNLLKTARGQIEGIIKMVEDDRYCIDISNQILATESILRKANKEIMKAHMEGCVKEAFELKNGNEKIEEIIAMIDKMVK